MTSTLLAIAPGDNALEVQQRLFEEVYEDLRRIASGLLKRERSNHTLQPTALVHEAYLRLVDHERVPWEGRAHFFGAAARAMRCILVDHARRKLAAKRGSRQPKVTIDESYPAPDTPQIELLALDDLLTKLANYDERMSRIVELRVFGGLKSKEMAHLLGVSTRTIDESWAMAKRWLRREMT